MTFDEWYDQLPPTIPHGHVAQMRMAWEAALASRSEADGGTKRDVARLDWLEQQSAHGLIIDIVSDWTYNGQRYGTGMRDAIDAAMRQSAPHNE